MSVAVLAHGKDYKFPRSLGSDLVESSNKWRFSMGRVDTCKSVHECTLLEKLLLIRDRSQQEAEKGGDVNIVSEKSRAPQEWKASPIRVMRLLRSKVEAKGAPVVVKRGQGLSECLFNRFEDFRLAQF